MRNLVRIAFIIMTTTQLSFSQSKHEERYIKWSPDNKLAYRDFQMEFKNYKKDTGLFRNFADAECGLFFEYNVNNDTLAFEVYAYFDKDSSIAFPTTPKYRIEHEQIVFDVCELYARKLIYYLQNLTNKENVKMLPDYFETLNDERFNFLIDIPFDTNSQKILSRKISKEIDSLKNFAEINGKVILH
jgi:hypothetical protein